MCLLYSCPFILAIFYLCLRHFVSLTPHFSDPQRANSLSHEETGTLWFKGGSLFFCFSMLVFTSNDRIIHDRGQNEEGAKKVSFMNHLHRKKCKDLSESSRNLWDKCTDIYYLGKWFAFLQPSSVRVHSTHLNSIPKKDNWKGQCRKSLFHPASETKNKYINKDVPTNIQILALINSNWLI